jgi:hypothetical protein
VKAIVLVFRCFACDNLGKLRRLRRRRFAETRSSPLGRDGVALGVCSREAKFECFLERRRSWCTITEVRGSVYLPFTFDVQRKPRYR